MNWQNYRLGEFISIKHGWAFKGEYFSSEGNYLLLTPGNAYEQGGLKIRSGKEKFYTGEFPPEFLLKKDDIVVIMTDLVQAAPILGGAIKIPKDDYFLHNQRLGLVEFKSDKPISKNFLYYLLNSPCYRAQIRGSATGATVRHTAPQRIYDCSILIPVSIEEQNAIANILMQYDLLIENNRKRIALLEESAHLLYQSLLNEGKKNSFSGWDMVYLEDLCDQIKEPVDLASIDSDTPYLSMEHMRSKSICLDTWEKAEKVSSSKLWFRKNDILFGRIRPYFHKVGLAQIDGITSTDMIISRVKNLNLLPIVTLTMSSEDFVDYAVTTSNGTKMPRADWKVLKKWKMWLPPKIKLEKFSEMILPIFEMISLLSQENNNLTKARDELLPKIISGQIKV